MTDTSLDNLVEIAAKTYTCPIHGDIGGQIVNFDADAFGAHPAVHRTYCFRCLINTLDQALKPLLKQPQAACEQQDETHSGSITNRALKLSTRGPDLWTPKGGE